LNEEAIVLADGNSFTATNLVKLLAFFGISCRMAALSDSLHFLHLSGERSSKVRILCSSDVFAQIAANIDHNAAEVIRWKEQVHSVFIYAGNDRRTLEGIVGMLSGDGAVKETKRCDADYVVSQRLSEVCGPMSGASIAAAQNGRVEWGFTLPTPASNRGEIISVGGATTFIKAEYHDVPVLLSSYQTVIDIDAIVASGVFDIREHLSSALPVVLYLKWAFPESCWRGPETNACLVIDDPVLKQSYGCLDFQKLLNLMQQYNFSTNIAFIPWNWKRSAPQVVRLFRDNPNNYSVSVHGCDHTRAEFGSSDRTFIRARTKKAIARMEQHKTETGIHHDRVMVFPQGVFSQESISVLKQSEFIAAVNNDTISSSTPSDPVKVRDLWDVAVMSYENFPIFTRRYPWEGIENFAFDILLGKPAIIVIHHDYCGDGYKRLIDFIRQLNALKCPVRWGRLEEVVQRSLRERGTESDVRQVEMYGNELRLENRSEKSRRYAIQRRESNPAGVKEILAGQSAIPWHSDADRLQCEVELESGASTIVKIVYHEFVGNGEYSDPFSVRAKTMARRYLSEFRDNYVTPTRLRLAGSR
jgi:hypothetical protein